MIAYFTTMFVMSTDYINNITIVTQEMSVASYIEAHFSFLQNSQREMLYNPNRPILNSVSFNVSRDSL